MKKYKKTMKKNKKINKKLIVKRKYTKKIKPILIPLSISSTEISLPKKRRGRRSKNGSSPNKMYFTQETENSIILYNNTIDEKIRNDIYNNHIKYPFEKLCECVFNSF